MDRRGPTTPVANNSILDIDQLAYNADGDGITPNVYCRINHALCCSTYNTPNRSQGVGRWLYPDGSEIQRFSHVNNQGFLFVPGNRLMFIETNRSPATRGRFTCNPNIDNPFFTTPIAYVHICK